MKKIIRVTTVPIALKFLLTDQMKFMKEAGFEVIMVSAGGPEIEDVKKNEGCRHQVIEMSRQITPLQDLRSLINMYRFLKKERPDILHSHTPKAGLISMLAGWMAGVDIRIHTVAGLRFMTAEGMTRRLLVFMEKLTASFATHVWPNSRSLNDYMVKENIASPKKMEVIGRGSSNGIDLQRFSEASLRADVLVEVKKKISYNEHLTYILNVGRVVRDKGVEELLQAFETVYSKNNDLRLVILGEFEDQLDPISENAKEILQRHPGVIHVGWDSRVEYYLHLSHLLVHASHREGFPNVLLQAGAMNCPIICSAIEGNIDVVEDGKTGLLFEKKNRKELEEKLSFALVEREQMYIYAGNLRKLIEDAFDRRIVHAALKEKYLNLLHEQKN